MTETIDFIAEIHPLIAEFQEMEASHKARIAPYLDAQGEVLEDLWEAFNTEAIRQAEEAFAKYNHTMERLSDLCGPPLPGTAHTLTFAGPERHDGENPYSFVVNGDSLDDARRNLGALPSFQEWFENMRDGDEPEAPDVVFVSGRFDSHPGIPDCGYYHDLRREQAEPPAAAGTGSASPVDITSIPEE